MTEEKTSYTRVEIPFSDLNHLKTTLRPVISTEGIFIETQYPPPIGTAIEMVLVIGPQAQEAACFRAIVQAHEPNDPTLITQRGVQLKFHELMPNAKELFGQLIPSTSPESPDLNDEQILSVEDLEFVSGDAKPEEAQNLSNTVEMSTRDLDEVKQESMQIEDLSGGLADYALRPDVAQQKEASFVHSNTEGQEFTGDDLSHLQGAGGYTMSDIILGIDLGTCNSCVSVVQDGHVKVLKDDKGNPTTPSIVSYLEDGTIIVGREAVSQMAKNPKSSIFGAKRLIGRNYHSPTVQNMIRFFPYKLLPDDKNHTAIDVFGKSVSLESVSSEILKYMVHIAQDTLHQEVDKVIVTVPAYYNDNQRAAVKEAGTFAGLNVVRIINEPTAAALAVGFNQSMQKRLLIYDFGGGTFDVSILEIKDNSFKVIATSGDNFLGGEDFDNRMVKWVLEHSKEDGVQLARNAVTFERLKQACERAKIELSTKKETGVNLPYIQTADNKTINFQKVISREQLVKLTRDLIERSLRLCDGVLNDANVTIKDIDEIILVGGMTRMPFIHNSVHQHYSKKPYGEVNPDEAVSMGAAILGGEITGSKKVSLVDALSMSIGIALPRNRFKPILMKQAQVPCQKQYKISADLSSEFTIDVFQGESNKCNENEYLGTLVFSDSVKTSDAQSLEIEFALTQECLLNCIIRNPSSGKSEKALLITHDTPPSAKLA